MPADEMDPARTVAHYIEPVEIRAKPNSAAGTSPASRGNNSQQ